MLLGSYAGKTLHRHAVRLGWWFPHSRRESPYHQHDDSHSKYFDRTGGATRLIRLRAMRHGIAAGYAYRAQSWLTAFHCQEALKPWSVPEFHDNYKSTYSPRKPLQMERKRQKDRYLNVYRIIASPRATLLSISPTRNGTIRQDLVLHP